MITQSELKTILHYDPETGLFTWKNKSVGKIAGTTTYAGYISINLSGKVYRAHRLAWLYMTGSFPKNQIDHINRKRHDNRFVNLHDVLNITNSKNRKKNINNKSGFNGVFWHKYNKLWVAKTRDCDRTVYLGSFKNLDDAIKARKNADIKYHFHPTHGKDI